MDAQQALADLTEISSQIRAAVVFDEKGNLAASTLDDHGRATALANGAARLLAQAGEIPVSGEAPLTQLEAATLEGSVFVVASGGSRIAATTGPEPTVGLVFYDLKSALRSISTTSRPRKPATGAKKKKATASTSTPKKATARKAAPARKKKTDAS